MVKKIFLRSPRGDMISYPLRDGKKLSPKQIDVLGHVFHSVFGASSYEVVYEYDDSEAFAGGLNNV